MTKQEWKDGYKLVVNFKPIEIPLSEWKDFIVATSEVDEDYDITEDMMKTFLETHGADIEAMMGKTVSIEKI